MTIRPLITVTMSKCRCLLWQTFHRSSITVQVKISSVLVDLLVQFHYNLNNKSNFHLRCIEPSYPSLWRGAPSCGRVHHPRTDLPDRQRPVQHTHLYDPVLHGPQGHLAATQEGQGVRRPHGAAAARRVELQLARQHLAHRAPLSHRSLQVARVGRLQAEVGSRLKRPAAHMRDCFGIFDWF